MIGTGRPLDWQFNPLQALRRYPLDKRVLMLHSGRIDPRWARWSLLAEPVGSYRFLAGDMTTRTNGRSIWSGQSPFDRSPPFRHMPFHDLRWIHQRLDGLLVGHLSYELGRWVEILPMRQHVWPDFPIIEFAYCPGYLLHDGVNETWYACGTWRQGGYPDLANLGPVHGHFNATAAESHVNRTDYEKMIQTAQSYIATGDIFQVNLAQRFTADFIGPYPQAHRAFYQQLAWTSPAWYGAYLELMDSGHAHRVIASTSPELFLQLDEEDRVITRPIKGTRPTSCAISHLRDSVKDTAELNMIVDLLRNDIGRVCDYGSVQVIEPRTIESHPTVHHGVATIGGQLHASKDLVDLLRATIPGGSITGAPKVRAMQIIDELEPMMRGPYAGAIGYISNNRSCFNIAIRTVLLETERSTEYGLAKFCVGGGIVADSEPADEYQETLDKAAAMLAALRSNTMDSRCHA